MKWRVKHLGRENYVEVDNLIVDTYNEDYLKNTRRSARSKRRKIEDVRVCEMSQTLTNDDGVCLNTVGFY